MHLEIKYFLRHQPWWGQGLDTLDNLCIPLVTLNLPNSNAVLATESIGKIIEIS